MAKASGWPAKVLALIKGGNAAAAIAQIRVAPTVKDLQQLRSLVAAAGPARRWPDVEAAIDDNIAALSSPRLHRSP